MKRFLALVLTIIFAIPCLFSCEESVSLSKDTTQKEEISGSLATEEPVVFKTVSDLLKAIKYDPYKYVNEKIQVKGTLIKQDDSGILALVDLSVTYTDTSVLDGYAGRYHYRNDPCIDIIITDDILKTVAESGDYMTVEGTVRISDEKIYLDNCTYTYE